MIATDLSKQQELYADPKSIQQINFTGNQDQDKNTTIFFSITEETMLDFSQGSVKYCEFILYQYKIAQYNTLNVKLSNSQLNKVKESNMIKRKKHDKIVLLANYKLNNLEVLIFKS